MLWWWRILMLRLLVLLLGRGVVLCLAWWRVVALVGVAGWWCVVLLFLGMLGSTCQCELDVIFTLTRRRSWVDS